MSRKIIAVDTYYFSEKEAKTVGIIFTDWADTKPLESVEAWTYDFGPYIPGEFYKRELPCLMDLLRKVPNLDKDFDAIVIDSLAWIPSSTTTLDGLGIRLENALISEGLIYSREEDTRDMATFGRPGIIGVAKTPFKGVEDHHGIAKVYRGKSKTPLYVNTTWFGYSSYSAGECIRSMAGSARIPTLLKMLDKETKTR